MLNFSQIKDSYSELEKLNPKAILVEYLQYELLDSIFKQKESAKLSFIGGTAIRIIYGGSRFSEDLDFDNFGLSFIEFENLSEKVVKDMKLKGFKTEMRLVEKGAFHCYIKFPKLLQNNNLAVAKNEKILVRIDMVNKEALLEPEIFTLDKFDVYRDILVNPMSVVLSQKLIAILYRKREKGRDFYDVSFLLARTKPDFLYIEKALSMKKEEFNKKLLERCEKLDFKALSKDVEPFLIKPEQISRVLNFEKLLPNLFS